MSHKLPGLVVNIIHLFVVKTALEGRNTISSKGCQGGATVEAFKGHREIIFITSRSRVVLESENAGSAILY